MENTGREIGIIFQEPMTSLNPVMTIGEQVEEAMRIHSISVPGNEKKRHFR